MWSRSCIGVQVHISTASVSELNRVTWGILGVTNPHIMFPGSVSHSVQAYSPCLKWHKNGKLFGETFFSRSSSWSENSAKGSRLYANANTRSQQHPDSAGWKEEDEGNSHSLSRVGECEQQVGLPRLTQPLSFSRSHTPPVWSINPVTVVPQMECFIRD